MVKSRGNKVAPGAPNSLISAASPVKSMSAIGCRLRGRKLFQRTQRKSLPHERQQIFSLGDDQAKELTGSSASLEV